MKKGFLGSIALLAALATMMSGCSSSNSSSKELRPDPNMQLKIAGSGSITQNGGISKPWTSINFTTSAVFRNLFLLTPGTGEIKGDLAESYTVSDDGLTYEIVMKDGVVWTDGETLDVEDVLFSLKALIVSTTSTTVYTMFSTAFLDIVGADAVLVDQNADLEGVTIDSNANTITITLNNPNNRFIHTLSQFSILPEHILGDIDYTTLHDTGDTSLDYWLNPVTSGMYKMGELVVGESVSYTYNDLYTEQAPYINDLVLRVDYTASELDYVETNDLSLILDYRAESNKTEYVADSIFYRYFLFNIDKGGELDPVLSDVRVRRAITHAIDREALVKNIYYGTGTVNDTGVVLEENNPLDVDYSYDPEKARALLEEAEYDFDRPFVLTYYYSDATSIAFMEGVAEYLEAIGLTVELFKGNLYNEESDHYDMGLKGLTVLSSTDWYNEYLSTSLFHQDIYGGEPLFDDLITELNQALTEEDRIEVLQELQQLEYDTLYKYPVFTMGHMAYINSNRVTVPNDIVFADSKYKHDIRLEEWQVDMSK